VDTGPLEKKGVGSLRRTTIMLLVLIAALAMAFAPTAAATPTAPSQPPYAGCTDWHLQSTYPMTPDDPRWVFTCTEGAIDWNNGTGWEVTNYYYWNDQLSEITAFETSIVDLDDWWFSDCTFYLAGQACEA
jgi:hypothetical protein